MRDGKYINKYGTILELSGDRVICDGRSYTKDNVLWNQWTLMITFKDYTDEVL